MPKQEKPFVCSQVILFRTNPQLCLPVQVFDQLSVIPRSNNLAFFVEWVKEF
jgi:hypothetical protein